MNKRGQSEVITTVLIILLVLAAVFIVYTAVRNMVTRGTGTASEKAKCIGINLEVTGVTNSNLEADPKVAATVSITRKAGGDSDALTPVILVKGVQRTPASCTPATLVELESTVCTLGTGTTDTVSSASDVAVGGKFGDATTGYTACEGTFTKA